MSFTILLTGLSGAGKTSISTALLESFPKGVIIPSWTTKPLQGRDADKGEYVQVTQEEFQEANLSGFFLETSRYPDNPSGNFYGTPLTPYFEFMESNQYPVKVINLEGVKSFKQELGDQCISIFIEPPNFTELQRRLLIRDGYLNEERLKLYDEEIANAHLCDYCVVNDILSLAVNRVRSIVSTEVVKRARAAQRNFQSTHGEVVLPDALSH